MEGFPLVTKTQRKSCVLRESSGVQTISNNVQDVLYHKPQPRELELNVDKLYSLARLYYGKGRDDTKCKGWHGLSKPGQVGRFGHSGEYDECRYHRSE